MKHVNIMQESVIPHVPGVALHSRRLIHWAFAILVLSGLFATPVIAADEPTLIYVVRHAEQVKKDIDPDKPLTAKGHARAATLAQRFEGIKITHVLSTHTDRTYDTVKQLAKAQGLEVKRIPALGSRVKGETITNRSKGKIAIKPMVKALRKLPPGSTAVVGANSGNIYAILAGLGARVGIDVPCKDKSCFPKKEYDNVWLMMRGANGAGTMAHFRYGGPYIK